LRGQLVRRNERVAHDYLDRIRARVVKGGISARTLVLCDGDVRSRLARAIVDEAVDLVVLSAQGRSGHSDVPFGSVAAYLIAHAVAPLLIICRHSTRATRRVAAAGGGTGGRLPSHAMQCPRRHRYRTPNCSRQRRGSCESIIEPRTGCRDRSRFGQASLRCWLGATALGLAAAEPEPEATKAAEWLLDND